MRAGALKHRVDIEKLDQSQSADWQAFSTSAMACQITDQGDGGDGMRRYEVRIRYSLNIRQMVTGIQDLGYAFRLLWTDPAGVSRELYVDSVGLPTERTWREPVILMCHEALQART